MPPPPSARFAILIKHAPTPKHNEITPFALVSPGQMYQAVVSLNAALANVLAPAHTGISTKTKDRAAEPEDYVNDVLSLEIFHSGPET